MHRFTKARSTIDPTIVVNGDGLRSTPIGSSPDARSTRINASPRCPALPVMRIDILRIVHGRRQDAGIASRAGCERPLRFRDERLDEVAALAAVATFDAGVR